MSTITLTQPITSPTGPAAPPFVDGYRMDIDEFERVAELILRASSSNPGSPYPS